MKKILALVIALVVGLVFLNIPALAAGPTAAAADIAPQPVRDALVVKCPQVADVGEKVLIKVVARSTGQPVPKVEVWALRWDPTADILPVANSALVGQDTIFLGYTDDLGEAVAIFRQAGRYMVLAVKEGFIPGFARISIQDKRALAIRAPESAKVLEPVPIRVVEKSVLTVEIPVSDAAVWALNVRTLSATTSNVLDLPAAAQKLGLYLGLTNEKGFVDPTPVFKQAGDYYLVAAKEGFSPAISKISIKAPVAITPTALPFRAITPTITLSPSAVGLNKRILVQP